MANLKDIPFVVIDLYSGSHTIKNKGHELFNLIPNPVDSRFYGYCPPVNRIGIRQLGAKKNADAVHDVMVIYVQKQPGSNDREIVAFTDCATIHNPEKEADGSMFRTYLDKDGSIQNANYCIESDYLYDLRKYEPKFTIPLIKTQMFRCQHFLKTKYPTLDCAIIGYLENYLDSIEKDDDFEEQEIIQNVILPKEGEMPLYDREPEYNVGSNGKTVKKRPELAKQVLKNANYECEVCPDHKTFLTRHRVQYMEGHHLIPCTPSNAKEFWEEYGVNIDCIENIVCICPTCHRRIHFGSDADKREMIEQLYAVKKGELESVGIKIDLEDMIKLYS